MIAFIRLSSEDEDILKKVSSRLVQSFPFLPGHNKVTLFPILFRSEDEEDELLF